MPVDVVEEPGGIFMGPYLQIRLCTSKDGEYVTIADSRLCLLRVFPLDIKSV